jgi:hypothetical protein
MFQIDETSLSLREKYLFKELNEFYTQQKIGDILIPLLSQNAIISLRALDWLVTNHSKKYNILCKSSINNGRLINIFHSYKLALGHYKRRYFDPFRRRTRFKLLFMEHVYETTIGQLNFLMWAHRLGILSYAYSHSQEIEKDMNTCTSKYRKERKENNRIGKKHQRHELSSAPNSLCIVYRTPTAISFDIDDTKNT